MRAAVPTGRRLLIGLLVVAVGGPLGWAAIDRDADTYDSTAEGTARSSAPVPSAPCPGERDGWPEAFTVVSTPSGFETDPDQARPALPDGRCPRPAGAGPPSPPRPGLYVFARSTSEDIIPGATSSEQPPRHFEKVGTFTVVVEPITGGFRSTTTSSDPYTFSEVRRWWAMRGDGLVESRELSDFVGDCAWGVEITWLGPAVPAEHHTVTTCPVSDGPEPLRLETTVGVSEEEPVILFGERSPTVAIESLRTMTRGGARAVVSQREVVARDSGLVLRRDTVETVVVDVVTRRWEHRDVLTAVEPLPT